MKSLKSVKTLLTKLEKNNSNHKAELMLMASEVFAKEMAKPAKQKELKRIVDLLHNSNELTSVNYDEYYHVWARVELSKLIDTKDELERELLQDFLSNYDCIHADFENDCVTTSIGPCILINHDGDVLDQDSGVWFISKSDYETEEERNKLVEEHMEDTGYFPCIIRCDYHGNAFYVKD